MKDIIVGIGEVLWDVFPEGKRLGGAPSNFAFHMSQFAFDSCVVSAVGDDALGRELTKTLQEKGVRLCIKQVPYPTGTVQVQVNEEGIPRYEIVQHVAWDNIPFTREIEELALRCRSVCFGTLAQRDEVSAHTINRFLDTMPDGALNCKIFDINLRQHFYTKDVIEKSLDKCNILKINDEELIVVSRLFAYQSTDLQEICKMLLKDYKLKMLILTCGANGSYVFSPDEISFLATPDVKVIDTVGAGDSFTAAFCAAILKGKSVSEAHHLAVEVSAYVCTQLGAMPELPQKLKDRLR